MPTLHAFTTRRCLGHHVDRHKRVQTGTDAVRGEVGPRRRTLALALMARL